MNGTSAKHKPQGLWTAFEVHAPDAERVALVGSFAARDWSQMDMRKADDGKWTATLRLPPGWYSYFFVVDGRHVLDPQGDATALDPVWGEVSLIELK